MRGQVHACLVMERVRLGSCEYEERGQEENKRHHFLVSATDVVNDGLSGREDGHMCMVTRFLG